MDARGGCTRGDLWTARRAGATLVATLAFGCGDRARSRGVDGGGPAEPPASDGPAGTPGDVSRCLVPATTPPGTVSGGPTPEGKWTNEYRVVEEKARWYWIPIDDKRLSAEGQLCCFCGGSVTLSWPDLGLLGSLPHPATVSKSGVCDADGPARVRAAAGAAGGIPGLAVVTLYDVVVRKGSDCWGGRYEEIRLSLGGCDTGEMPLIDFFDQTWGPLEKIPQDTRCPGP